MGGRRLPDIRLGQLRAVRGRVTVGGPDTPATDGQVTLQLLHPADSTAYGDAVTTHDDGSYQLWFPAGTDGPTCDWLIRAVLADGVEVIEPWPSNGSSCQGDQWMDLEMPGA